MSTDLVEDPAGNVQSPRPPMVRDPVAITSHVPRLRGPAARCNDVQHLPRGALRVAQDGLVPRLPWELDALLHLPARALGRATADRQVRGRTARRSASSTYGTGGS